MKDVQYVLIDEGLFTARSTRIGTNICQIIGQFIIKNQIKKQIKIKFKNYILNETYFAVDMDWILIWIECDNDHRTSDRTSHIF